MLLQDFLVDSRAEVKALKKGLRGELQQVLEAGAVLGQEGDMVAGLFGAAGVLLVVAASGRDVGLDAEDRVDARVLGRFVELQRTVQIAVVGQGQGVHAQLFGPLQEAGDFAGAVQEAIVAMAMQMGERLGHGHFLASNRANGLKGIVNGPAAFG